jgi:ABC-type nitrate/sulfonate/bicarbonate transport system substrate-binding protein
MIMQKLSTVGLLTITLSISLGGCFGSKDSTPTASDSSPAVAANGGLQISWGGPKNISMLPLIAEKQGFLGKVGLTAQRQDIQTGKLAMDAVSSGKLDIGILVDTNIAFVGFQPSKLKVVAVISEKTDDAIIGRRDKGVTNAKSLEGKRLGVTFGTTSQAMAMSYLQSKGVNTSKVTFINQPPSALQAALTRGDIDAAALWNPLRFNVKASLKESAIELRDNPGYTARAIVVVREDYAKTHQKEINQFLQAMLQAEEYVKTNTTEAQSFLSTEVGIPANVLSSSWSEYNLKVSMSRELLTSIEKQGKWIVATQPSFKGKAVPPYKEALDSSFLQQVRSDRVTGL